jgi:hypothetical protein
MRLGALAVPLLRLAKVIVKGVLDAATIRKKPGASVLVLLLGSAPKVVQISNAALIQGR